MLKKIFGYLCRNFGKMRILIVNGPNLNLLGKREPEVYGKLSFEAYLPQLRERFPQHQIDYYQSNHEGYLIDKLQEGRSSDSLLFSVRLPESDGFSVA